MGAARVTGKSGSGAVTNANANASNLVGSSSAQEIASGAGAAVVKRVSSATVVGASGRRLLEENQKSVDRKIALLQRNERTNEFLRPVPEELRGAFRMCVIDPPYITTDVWKQYVATAKWILEDGGLLLCTTVIENATFLQDALGVQPNTYLPSIPQLSYQYAVVSTWGARARPL